MEDRCTCCGDIIPEGSHVCPNCKVAVNRGENLDAYAYLAKYLKEVVRCQYCEHWKKAKSDKKGNLICQVSGMKIKATDFCSYGERRKDGT